MGYHVNVQNVDWLVERAAAAACIAAPRGPWHDREYRLTFAEWDVDRITGALGWVFAAAGIHSVPGRRAVAQLSHRDDGLPYHLWPSLYVDGAQLVEPDLHVLRALDAACDAANPAALRALVGTTK